MRYGTGHKETTRQRILDAASRRFRAEGIAAVGVAGLMADAGLTHGGFYAHFPSKEDLVREAVADALDQTLARMTAKAEDGGLAALIAAYLSPEHRDRPETGCAIACLGPELTRHPPETRDRFAAKTEAFIELIARHLPADDQGTGHRARATALLGLLSGTLQLARAATDAEQSEHILAAGRQAALAIAVPPCNPRP
jgi:TetR/AcrR family transcriptional regulator, transcriptional repressor for nem operon